MIWVASAAILTAVIVGVIAVSLSAKWGRETVRDWKAAERNWTLATANWERAEQNWKRAAANWARAESAWNRSAVTREHIAEIRRNRR